MHLQCKQHPKYKQLNFDKIVEQFSAIMIIADQTEGENARARSERPKNAERSWTRLSACFIGTQIYRFINRKKSIIISWMCFSLNFFRQHLLNGQFSSQPMHSGGIWNTTQNMQMQKERGGYFVSDVCVYGLFGNRSLSLRTWLQVDELQTNKYRIGSIFGIGQFFRDPKTRRGKSKLKVLCPKNWQEHDFEVICFASNVAFDDIILIKVNELEPD